MYAILKAGNIFHTFTLSNAKGLRILRCAQNDRANLFGCWYIILADSSKHAQAIEMEVDEMGIPKRLSAICVVLIMAICSAMPAAASNVPAPVPPANPIGIQSIVESAAIAPGMVQLTVVAGTATNFVWIRFEGNRYVHGTRTASDLTSSTWVIDYMPRFDTPHSVTVYSNRQNTPTGADSRTITVYLQYPFIPTEHLAIQSVTITPRVVTGGSEGHIVVQGPVCNLARAFHRDAIFNLTMVTLSIRTHADIGAVWIRDVDGIERMATAVWPTTATMRTWEIDFSPTRSGYIVVFANQTHSHWGAAERSEFIDVGGSGRASIRQASANIITDWYWGMQSNVVIRVTTNQHANSVWAVLPDRQIVPLRHVLGFGLTDRVWEAAVWTDGLPISVHAAEVFGVVGGFSDSSMMIDHWTFPLR